MAKVNAEKINKKIHWKPVQNSFKEVMNPVGWGQCHLFLKPRVEVHLKCIAKIRPERNNNTLFNVYKQQQP